MTKKLPETWLQEAWQESKRLMLIQVIKKVLNEVGEGGSIHLLTQHKVAGEGSMCLCGSEGHCESIIAERIASLAKSQEIL